MTEFFADNSLKDPMSSLADDDDTARAAEVAMMEQDGGGDKNGSEVATTNEVPVSIVNDAKTSIEPPLATNVAVTSESSTDAAALSVLNKKLAASLDQGNETQESMTATQTTSSAPDVGDVPMASLQANHASDNANEAVEPETTQNWSNALEEQVAITAPEKSAMWAADRQQSPTLDAARSKDDPNKATQSKTEVQTDVTSEQESCETATNNPDGSRNDAKADEKSGSKRKRRVASKAPSPAGGVPTSVKGHTGGDANAKHKRKKVAAKSTLSGNKPAGKWSGSTAKSDLEKSADGKNPTAAKVPKSEAAKRAKNSPKDSSSAKKKSPSSVGSAPKRNNPEVWSGPPDDALQGGWPQGWIKKKFERQSGTLKGRADSYWFSPATKKKLRSMAEVKRFLAALRQNDGDEERAWAAMKNPA